MLALKRQQVRPLGNWSDGVEAAEEKHLGRMGSVEVDGASRIVRILGENKQRQVRMCI